MGSALVALVVIGVATFLVYSNTFDASFHFDDVRAIVRNESLRHLRTQWLPHGNRYLGYLSFALNYRIGGLEVFGYHLANLLIHLGSSLLVFWLTAITLRTPALQRAAAGPFVRRYLPLTAGILFAVHPVQTQAVTYIVQRFASLATLFYLLSLAFYAQGRLSLEAGAAKARAVGLYLLSVVAAIAAMKTKEISFTLPVVVAAYEVVFFRVGRRLLLLAPLAATALLVPLGLAAQGQKLADVLGDAGRFAAEAQNIPRSVYLLTQSRVVVTYLRLLVFPVDQNLDYDVPLSHSAADPRVVLATAVLLALVAFAVFLLRRARQKNRAPGILVFFGVAWFFVTLSVESSIIPIHDVIFEHRVYLPSVGAAIALGTALLCGVERLRWSISPWLQVAGVLAITAGPLGVAAYARNFVWRDDLTLWRDVVAKSPGKARPHLSLAIALRDRGAVSEAMNESLVALKILPEYPEAHDELGIAYREKGQLDDAVREHREAIRLQPALADPHNNLGAAYQEKGQLDDAVREYREAIRLVPGLAVAHSNLGNAYKAKDQLDDAVLEYREAIRLDPGLVDPHNNLGNVFKGRGQLDDALREYREATRLDPGLAGPHYNLGAAYQAKGQLDDALREYREAIRLDPGQAGPHHDLGVAYQAKGQLDDAVRELVEAIRLDPSRANAHFNLGAAYRAKAQLDEAVREYREAIHLDPSMAAAHLNLGTTYHAKGKLDDAVREYREAIQLDSSMAAAFNNLGVALDAKGQVDDAARAYREAIRLDPALAGAHFSLGALLAKRGSAAEAAEHYRRALKLEPTPETVLNLAVALDDAGDSAEAIPLFKRFLVEAGNRFPDRAEQVRNRLAQLGVSVEPALR